MLLDIRNVSKRFSVRSSALGTAQGVVRAVEDVSLQLHESEHLGIVGESGSGKTTLARLICQLYPLSEGRILYKDQPVQDLKRDFQACVQMVFQDPYSSLDPRFNIRAIIKEGMPLTSQKVKTEQEKELYTQELMKAVGLTHDMLNRYPHEFSGGERQRIAIARALAARPKILILDEAVSSLDMIIQDQILSLLKDVQKQFGLTYLFISHDLKAVKRICQRIAVMYQGRIVEVGSTEQIFNHARHPYTQRLLSAALRYQVADEELQVQVTGCKLVDLGDQHFILE